MLHLLTRYCRNQFTDPSPGRAAAARLEAKNRSTSASRGRLSTFTAVRRRVVKKAFYSDEEDESDEEVVMLQRPSPSVTGATPVSGNGSNQRGPEVGSLFTGADADVEGDLDPDHRLLLKASLPLLKSRNAAVVVSVCTLHFYCGSRSGQTTIQMGKALIRILKNHREIQYVVLTTMLTMAQEQPSMFLPYLPELFVKASDPIFNRLLKLDIVASLATTDNAEQILKEFQSHIRHPNDSFVCGTIRAVGRVADAAPALAGSCMEGLLQIVKCAQKPKVLTEAVIVLRQLLQQNKDSKTTAVVLHQLVKLLVSDPRFKEAPVARASVVWLVGEFHDVLRKLAPDILRILAADFADEATETKTQIANFALKLSLRLPDDDKVQSLMTYVLEMARYDVDVDLRDRSRFMTAMMGLAPSSGGEEAVVDEDALEEVAQHSENILLAPKLPPLTLQGPVDIEGLPRFTLGSLSSVVGHHVQGYTPLPAWQEVQPDASVREAVSANTSTITGSSKQVVKHSPYADVSSSSDSDAGGRVVKGASKGKGKTVSVLSSSSDSEDDSDSNRGSSDSDESDSDVSSEESSSEDESDESPPVPASRVSSQPSAGAAGMSIRKVTGSSLKKATPAPTAAMTTASLLGNDGQMSPTPMVTSDNLLDLTYPRAAVGSGYSTIGNDDLLSTFTPSSSTGASASQPSGAYFNTSPQLIPATTDMLGIPTQPSTLPTPTPPARSGDADILSEFMESFQQPPEGAVRSAQSIGAPAADTPTASLPVGEILSMPHTLLRPELAGGLSASIIFRHGARPTLPGASCVLMEFCNTSSDHYIR